MPQMRIVISVPVEIKLWLDTRRCQGYTNSGYIRALIEREYLAEQADVVLTEEAKP